MTTKEMQSIKEYAKNLGYNSIEKYTKDLNILREQQKESQA